MLFAYKGALPLHERYGPSYSLSIVPNALRQKFFLTNGPFFFMSRYTFEDKNMVDLKPQQYQVSAIACSSC